MTSIDPNFSTQIEQLSRTVRDLETAIIEIRVALLGGLDGRPGLLAQLASVRNDMGNTRNELKFTDTKIDLLQKDLKGVQQDNWITKGKLVGAGGILGAVLSKAFDFLK